MSTKKQLVSKHNEQSVPVVKQCKLIELSRSNHYYIPKQKNLEAEGLLINELHGVYSELPFYGYKKQTLELKTRGFVIGKEKVRNYKNFFGLNTLYPKARTTIPNKKHKKYPYLLNNVVIDRPNQVWAVDITYIKMKKGFCYLVAIIDWYSRKILSYRLSNSLDCRFCIEALNEALTKYPAPEIFNSDQGCQFTSCEFTKILRDKNIKISMDAKGRAIDNIIIERFWRTIKYENIFLREYSSIDDLKFGVNSYIKFYNNKRFHESLGYKTPNNIYDFRKEGALVYGNLVA